MGQNDRRAKKGVYKNDIEYVKLEIKFTGDRSETEKYNIIDSGRCSVTWHIKLADLF